MARININTITYIRDNLVSIAVINILITIVPIFSQVPYIQILLVVHYVLY